MTKADLQGVIDLCAEHYKIPSPRLTHWRRTQAGRAHYSRNTITLPLWPLKKHGEDYMLAYTIHEAAHFVANEQGSANHDNVFKSIEAHLLSLFGYYAKWIRGRAYYDELYSAGGRKLYP